MAAADRLLYGVTQAARVGWYFGHYLAGQRFLQPMPAPGHPVGPTPTRLALMRELAALFRRDMANIEAGLYPLPADLAPAPSRLLRRSIAYFRDLPEVDRRRRARIADEAARDPAHARLPRYYRQNFHYQSDGYLSPRSARLYDTQVEVLFTGGADAMRRQGLVPLAEYCRTRRSRELALLDIGCGTGRFLHMAKQAWPALSVTGADLSLPYLREARRALGGFRRVALIQAAAEALPLPDASQDMACCVFLLHELPRRVRAALAGEAARVLRPGGRLVVIDSLQKGDRPDWDGLLDLFPHAFHEPYYRDYCATDLAALFGAAGLRPAGTQIAFLAKVATFDKPLA